MKKRFNAQTVRVRMLAEYIKVNFMAQGEIVLEAARDAADAIKKSTEISAFFNALCLKLSLLILYKVKLIYQAPG